MSLERTTTLELVVVRRKSLEDYRRTVGDAPIDEARSLAQELKGRWLESNTCSRRSIASHHVRRLTHKVI